MYECIFNYKLIFVGVHVLTIILCVMTELVVGVACCGALLYPGARSRNVETCGPSHSVY